MRSRIRLKPSASMNGIAFENNSCLNVYHQTTGIGPCPHFRPPGRPLLPFLTRSGMIRLLSGGSRMLMALHHSRLRWMSVPAIALALLLVLANRRPTPSSLSLVFESSANTLPADGISTLHLTIRALDGRSLSPRDVQVAVVDGARRALEMTRQYRAKLPRCHRTTVSGVTTIRACFHRGQYLSARTQKSLSNTVRRGRGCLRIRTASCCRRARFSSQRLRCVRKRRTIEASKSPMVCNMAGCYRESPVDGNALCC